MARVGEAPEELKARLGEPVAISLDQEGFGLGKYKTPGFKEIRVTFVAGKSQFERYFPVDEKAAREPIVEKLRQENPGQEVDDALSFGVEVGTEESANELKFVDHSGAETSFSGTLQIKNEFNGRYAVLRTSDQVIEIYFGFSDIEFRSLRSGLECVVTLLDGLSDNLDEPMAVVGRREHVDWLDATHDPHDKFQQLVKITSDGKTLFDRTVCGVHGKAMELRNVDIAYGLLAIGAQEQYCEKHFPHAQAYVRGGCVVTNGSPQFAAIYICPDCVAACKQYSEKHPVERR